MGAKKLLNLERKSHELGGGGGISSPKKIPSVSLARLSFNDAPAHAPAHQFLQFNHSNISPSISHTKSQKRPANLCQENSLFLSFFLDRLDILAFSQANLQIPFHESPTQRITYHSPRHRSIADSPVRCSPYW